MESMQFLDFLTNFSNPGNTLTVQITEVIGSSREVAFKKVIKSPIEKVSLDWSSHVLQDFSKERPGAGIYSYMLNPETYEGLCQIHNILHTQQVRCDLTKLNKLLDILQKIKNYDYRLIVDTTRLDANDFPQAFIEIFEKGYLNPIFDEFERISKYEHGRLLDVEKKYNKIFKSRNWRYELRETWDKVDRFLGRETLKESKQSWSMRRLEYKNYKIWKKHIV